MMFLWEMISNWLDVLWKSLGLSGKEGTVILLGLDNAGKTTLLHRLRTGKIQQHAFPPTDRPSATANRFQYQGIALSAWDLGGHEVVRHLWADFVTQEDQPTKRMAILFLIDASDLERIEEAGYELDHLIHESLLSDHPTLNGDVSAPATDSPSSSSVPPLAILLNKCDLDTAATTEDVCQRIDWQGIQKAYPQDRIQIFRGSVWNEEGYPDAFRWMAEFF